MRGVLPARPIARRRQIALHVPAIIAGVLLCTCWLGAQLYQDLPHFGDTSVPPLDPAEANKPAEFVLARMQYTDRYEGQHLDRRPWQIDAPAAEYHLLQGVQRLSAINTRQLGTNIHPDEPDFFDYPLLYVVEPGHWELTDSEARHIREYLLRGGFIVFDDFHGSEEWSLFMDGLRRIFPERPVVDLKDSDEIFHVLFDMNEREQIPGIQMLFSHRSYERDGIEPHWRGIYDLEGRLMVMINHNMDLGDAWEHADEPMYPERFTAMSYRLAINYIIYAMTH